MEDQILHNADFVARNELTLPMYANITNEQIDFIIDAIRSYCKNS